MHNCSPDVENTSSNKIVKSLNQKIQDDSDQPNVNKIDNAVHKVREDFETRGCTITQAATGCIVLRVKCSSILSLLVLLRDYVTGSLDASLKELEEAAHSLKCCEDLRLETVINEDEFYRIISDLDFRQFLRSDQSETEEREKGSDTTAKTYTFGNVSKDKASLVNPGQNIKERTSLNEAEAGVEDTICHITPQNMPLFCSVNNRNPQVQNSGGGYVFKVDDMKRLARFLIFGSEGIRREEQHELQKEIVSCLKRLIDCGNGVAATKLINEVNTNRRNLKQNSLLLACAICARSNDQDTKTAAYSMLSSICRNPKHLFMLIKYCENESIINGTEFGTGWGRAHRKAISKWYTNFRSDPETLARYVTKYKSHEGWTHRDVLRLAHTSTDDKCVGFILRYITNGLDKAREMYIQNAAEIDDETRVKLNKLMEVFERAVKITDEDQMCYEIREHKLTWEQCNSELLKSPKVWMALLPHMGAEAVIRNLGRMTCIGMFAEDSADEALVLSKIQSMNSYVEIVKDETEEPAEGQDEMRKNLIHPFKILLAICTYKSGKGQKGRLHWSPNERILAALDTAFYKAFETVVPTGKKFYLGVDVSGSMSQPVLGGKDIRCSTAAAAMMLLTAKTELNYIIKGFSDKIVEIGVTPYDTLDVVQNKMDRIPMGGTDCAKTPNDTLDIVQSKLERIPIVGTDCAKPMFDAMENKIKDIDVFVIYTENETCVGNCHPVEALRQYRVYAENPQVKLIVCNMCSTEFSIADQEDPNMLDVVGFDSAAPRLISEFVMENL